MQSGSLTYAGRVRPGDQVKAGDQFLVVTKINRARGRKPKYGENLHLITEYEVLKHNSHDPVRVRRTLPRAAAQ
jgi:hypothetical protein